MIFFGFTIFLFVKFRQNLTRCPVPILNIIQAKNAKNGVRLKKNTSLLQTKSNTHSQYNIFSAYLPCYTLTDLLHARHRYHGAAETGGSEKKNLRTLTLTYTIMRNLIATHIGTVKVSGNLSEDGEPVLVDSVCFDPVTDSLFCLFKPNFGLIDIKRALKDGSTDTLLEIPVDESYHGEAVARDIKYLSDTSSTVIFFANGEYKLISDEIEGVEGAIEGAISDAKWSPDEELVVIAAKDSNSLMVLTRDIDLLTETVLSQDDLKLSKHVSVGWGKKETQFEGRGAKAMRDPTMPVKVDSGRSLESDSGQMHLTWRGDGQYFCVSSLDNISNDQGEVTGTRRTIRMYTREGALDGVSEPVDGLLEYVAWRPSGELIATVRKNFGEDGEYEVVFFERNGLKRYSFNLGIGSDAEILGLSWNSNSEILTVRTRQEILLWTSKNYHWYLKQVIPASQVCWNMWHPERPYSLFVGLSDGSIETHSFVWDTITGPVVKNDEGKVAVIDKNIIKITPLKKANVPPPMALRDINWARASGETENFHAPVHCTFDENNKLYVLSRTHVIVYNEDEKSVKSAWRHDCDARQIASANGLVAIACHDKRVAIFDAAGQLVNEYPISAYLLRPTVDYSTFWAETASGKVFLLEEAEPKLLCQLPQRCTRVEIAGDSSVFGLTESGKLYRNLDLIANSVTSFIVSERLLIFTTSQHFLKLCHINDEKISVPEDTSKDDERCRDIERGSLLVAAIPSKTSLVLQAPRGNLETIFPRILVLMEVRRNITIKRYDLAFALCRIHRIDLNILHDFSPEQFFDSLRLFVEQLRKIEYLDLFLSGLKEEDVSKTMYRDTLVDSTEKEEALPKDKVNRICKALLPHLIQRSRLTAYACMTPPDLKSAFEEIQLSQHVSERESAIQYLCFLQDVEVLYKTALGLYNLDMSLLVAQQSQKDPKEYLPFLRDLKKMTDKKRRFTIDDHLKNYKKALRSLYSSLEAGETSLEEFIDYTVRHELYKEAQTLSARSKLVNQQVLEKYASYLYGKTNYLDAAICYESLGMQEKALDAYVIGGSWRQALTIAPTEKVHELSEHLIEILQAQHHYKDCGIIYKEYLNDTKHAVEMLCQGYAINDAFRLADEQLLKSVISPKLLELYGTMSELANDCKQQIGSQLARLRELREKKTTDPLAFYGNGESNADVPDNVSIAASETTSGSVFTRYTGKTGGTAQTGASRRTAKNKRREERKRARGKKGTVYEEEYLMKSLSRLSDRLNDSQNDARALLEGLFRQGYRDHAHILQKQFAEVTETLIGILDEVFTISEKDRERFDEDGELYILPEITKPIVKPFPKLAVLDYE